MKCPSHGQLNTMLSKNPSTPTVRAAMDPYTKGRRDFLNSIINVGIALFMFNDNEAERRRHKLRASWTEKYKVSDLRVANEIIANVSVSVHCDRSVAEVIRALTDKWCVKWLIISANIRKLCVYLNCGERYGDRISSLIFFLTWFHNSLICVFNYV